jgi:hypothetical protein
MTTTTTETTSADFTDYNNNEDDDNNKNKLEAVTSGLPIHYITILKKQSKQNALTISEYLLSIKYRD